MGEISSGIGGSSFRGRAWKFGDSVSTDDIIAGRYKFKTLDMRELARHAMENIRPGFADQVKPGDIIVAGWNFGCGSSREHAPRVLKELGISCIIAKSFARIFYRNSITIGLPLIECSEAVDRIDEGDEVEVILDKGIVRNLTKKLEFKAKPYPEFLLKILREGGLIEYVKRFGRLPWQD